MKNRFTPIMSLLISSVVFLSWCGSTQTITAITKTPFYIQTQAIQKSSEDGYITKNTKVIGKSDIILTAQTAWRVQNIIPKIGDNVSAQATLISLSDLGWNISFGTQKTALATESAQNAYAVQKENLEKQVQDAQIAFDRAKIWYDSTLADAQKQTEKTVYDLSNTDKNITGSSTQIQLQKLQKDLERSQFDYQAKLKSDEQTLQNFIASAKNISSDLSNLISDVTDQSDKFLWVTVINQNYNNDYEVQIWAKDINTRFAAEDQFRTLDWLKTQIASLNSDNITIDNIPTYLTTYKRVIDGVNAMVIKIKAVVLATVPSMQLPQSAIDWLNAWFNAQQSRSSAMVSNITAQLNAINSFISTYKDTQQSLAKNIDSLKDQITLAQKWLDDASFNTKIWADRVALATDSQTKTAELWLKQSQTSYEFAKNTKELNLESLQNNLKSAQVALAQAQFDQSKLAVRAPIKWIIADILVDLGQEVSPWTPLIKFVSDAQEVDVNLSQSEIQYVQEWQAIQVVSQYGNGEWVITSISKVADKSGNFKVVISLSQTQIAIWSFVDVKIPLQKWNNMIPLNAVQIVDNNIWQINLWDGTKIITRSVKISNSFGNEVEISDQIPLGSRLIITDLWNYDPEKMKLEVKN